MSEGLHAADETQALSQRLGRLLAERGLSISCAESCTGGGIAAAITDISGSSQWFERGFVTYANSAKNQMLGVSNAVLEAHGAVSQPVVEAMAVGALTEAGADIAIASSGIAGPGGGSEAKPVGTVWLAWAWQGTVQSHCYQFDGDRRSVRHQAVHEALRACVDLPVLTQFRAQSR